MNWLAQISIGENYTLGETGPGVNSKFSDLGKLISPILSTAYILAGVIFLFLLIGGGISVIVGAGQNNPEAAAKGQKAITAAIVGFLVIFASYWIIQIVSKVTGLDILGGGGL